MAVADSDPEGLLAYFTDVEELRALFRSVVAALTMPKRILVVHGIGCVGKSSLLRMFRLHCKGIHMPVALASADESKSASAILASWAQDLKADGVTLPTFARTLQHYRTLQARFANKAQAERRRMGDLAGKTAGMVAEAGAGAAIGALAGSVIPGVGTVAGSIGGALSGMGAEALVGWLRGRGFDEIDIDLLLDPAKRLTDDFVADVDKVAGKRRLVLMLDTFEQLNTLEDWSRNLAQQLHPNILLVIAGRAIPRWDRAQSGWLAQAYVKELKPMDDKVMRELIARYCATIGDVAPNPKQADAIVAFARGLPLVVTTAVRLWVEYGVEDFEAVKPEVVADLVDQLKEGVPPELTPVLEAAATVRWFNREILRVLTSQADVTAAYDELRRFPFVRSRAEGLALHDAVREIMDEGLRMQEPQRHRLLHERAAEYLEVQMAQHLGEEANRLWLERMFHCVCADEESGLKLFREAAEELARCRLITQLSALVNDAGTYRLERIDGSLWREYYGARVADLETRFVDAERTYQAIAEHRQAEPKLRAYVLCDWATLLGQKHRLGQAGVAKKAIHLLEESLELVPLDQHLSASLFGLARIARYQGRWEQQIGYLDRARLFFEKQGDPRGLVTAYGEMRRANARRGLWKDFIFSHQQAISTLSQLSLPAPALKALNLTVLGDWGWSLALVGRPAECERNMRRALKIARELRDELSCCHVLRDLAWGLGAQDKFDDANLSFAESLAIARKMSKELPISEGSVLGFWGATLSRNGDSVRAQDYLVQSLKIKEALGDIPGIQEPAMWLGVTSETQGKLDEALDYYDRNREWRWYRRYYFDAIALTGLVRIKHAQGAFGALAALLAEAEPLCQQYEYNDHLASLRLTQGHVVWDGHFAEWGSGFDAAFLYYRYALICALRYNRFLLDEVLSGRLQGTPLYPIIPSCLQRGGEGSQMLITLRDWWETGINDVGTPRPDTISPIPEGISLLEAERIAREREPGDGSSQLNVVEQIEQALRSKGS